LVGEPQKRSVEAVFSVLQTSFAGENQKYTAAYVGVNDFE